MIYHIDILSQKKKAETRSEEPALVEDRLTTGRSFSREADAPDGV
jgi:hypothetical protein